MQRSHLYGLSQLAGCLLYLFGSDGYGRVACRLLLGDVLYAARTDDERLARCEQSGERDVGCRNVLADERCALEDAYLRLLSAVGYHRLCHAFGEDRALCHVLELKVLHPHELLYVACGIGLQLCERSLYGSDGVALRHNCAEVGAESHCAGGAERALHTEDGARYLVAHLIVGLGEHLVVVAESYRRRLVLQVEHRSASAAVDERERSLARIFVCHSCLGILVVKRLDRAYLRYGITRPRELYLHIVRSLALQRQHGVLLTVGICHLYLQFGSAGAHGVVSRYRGRLNAHSLRRRLYGDVALEVLARHLHRLLVYVAAVHLAQHESLLREAELRRCVNTSLTEQSGVCVGDAHRSHVHLRRSDRGGGSLTQFETLQTIAAQSAARLVHAVDYGACLVRLRLLREVGRVDVQIDVVLSRIGCVYLVSQHDEIGLVELQRSGGEHWVGSSALYAHQHLVGVRALAYVESSQLGGRNAFGYL